MPIIWAEAGAGELPLCPYVQVYVCVFASLRIYVCVCIFAYAAHNCREGRYLSVCTCVFASSGWLRLCACLRFCQYNKNCIVTDAELLWVVRTLSLLLLRLWCWWWPSCALNRVVALSIIAKHAHFIGVCPAHRGTKPITICPIDFCANQLWCCVCMLCWVRVFLGPATNVWALDNSGSWWIQVAVVSLVFVEKKNVDAKSI